MTNFDFAGNPITDPSQANWTVNQGPISDPQSGDYKDDVVVSYDFYAWLWVPITGVEII